MAIIAVPPDALRLTLGGGDDGGGVPRGRQRLRRRGYVTLVAVGLALTAGLQAQAQAPNGDASRLATERLRALRAEADALAAEQQTMLVELRKLEVSRQLRAEALRAVTAETEQLAAELADTGRQAELLAERQQAQAPAWRARMVALHQLGHGGYLRMLLGVDDVRQVGWAYRTVSALAGRDRELARAHQSTRQSLERAKVALAERHAALEAARRQAVEARAAADRAVREHAALIAAIDSRRDLNAQLTGELQAARARLHATIAGLGSDTALLPVRPFRGALAWPVPGQGAAPADAIARRAEGRSGIEIPAAPGARVAAIHDGVVAYSGPFTGFGELVIVDHGGAHSVYGHLERRAVARGSRVARGEALGTVGTAPSGTTGLYFELRVDGAAVDPLQWLKRQP
jgi:murein hydrolase activator